MYTNFIWLNSRIRNNILHNYEFTKRKKNFLMGLKKYYLVWFLDIL
jgi:hypothetical protein